MRFKSTSLPANATSLLALCALSSVLAAICLASGNARKQSETWQSVGGRQVPRWRTIISCSIAEDGTWHCEIVDKSDSPPISD
jgi:hypothetical protein